MAHFLSSLGPSHDLSSQTCPNTASCIHSCCSFVVHSLVLVVDEIKRGNLAKIFEELYFLLEYRDEAIDLMYSSDDAESFTLRHNVVIIFRVEHRGPLDRPRGHCYAPVLRIRSVARRGSRRNLPLRRWLTARKYPQRVRGPAQRAERCNRPIRTSRSGPRISCALPSTVTGIGAGVSASRSFRCSISPSTATHST